MARRYNHRPDAEDRRDRLYISATHSDATTLPKKVDLRSNCTDVVDQGELGSCTANAIASGLREYLERKIGPVTRLSRLWLYWMERSIEGTLSEDAGADIRDGMKVLQKVGCAREEDWPYIIAKFKAAPPTLASVNAAAYKIAEYHRVADLFSLKAALADGYPVVLGMEVYSSFESSQVEATGLVPMPKRRENCLGGHAVLAVGYIDNISPMGASLVICRNSWGSSWGDKGYFYLPDSYVRAYVTDMWTGK